MTLALLPIEALPEMLAVLADSEGDTIVNTEEFAAAVWRDMVGMALKAPNVPGILWREDALEQIALQAQTIEAMKARIAELEGAMGAAKSNAESIAKAFGLALFEPGPDEIGRDMSGHINLMGAHGDPDYLKGGASTQTCRHTDLRSRAPRKSRKEAA
jgi:hypothetical protein